MTLNLSTISTDATPSELLFPKVSNSTKPDFCFDCQNPINSWIIIPFENDIINPLKKIIESDSYKTMIASEKVLSKDWDTPEEDEAWANL